MSDKLLVRMEVIISDVIETGQRRMEWKCENVYENAQRIGGQGSCTQKNWTSSSCILGKSYT
jgi:hypothetical protein